MPDVVLPTVGSSGYYELRSPLNTLVVIGERYTCQAIRRISDYLANNEEVKQLVYTDQGIETDFDADADKDAYILSLQSDKGHWIYVPASYIVSYPIVNGIPYRSIMIGLSLPSMPADRDLSFLEADLSNLITDSLGVVPVIRQVETSRVILVDKARHDQLQIDRNLLSSGRVTDRSRLAKTQQDLQVALDKIAILEQYIKDHL